MAKVVLMRPNVAAFCTFQAARFFCSSNSSCRLLLPCFQGTKSCSSVVRLAVLMMPIENSRTKFPTKTETRRNLCVRATTHVNDPGSIDSPLIKSMEKKIEEHLNAESVIVKDAYGDGRHVSIDVISSAFEGESAVSRQRMVYKAIWEELQSTVHAVDQMTTRTPAEAKAAATDKTW